MSTETRNEIRGSGSGSCEKTRTRLDAYLDGDLPAAEGEELDRHFEGCAACRDELEALRHLLAEARRLPRSVEPPRDLWPGIEARLGGGRANPSRPLLRRFPGARPLFWLPLAAAAVLLAALLAPLALRWSSPDTPLGPAAGSPAPPSRAASRQVLAALERQQDHLTPAAVRSVTQSVAALDRSIGEIRAALARDPDNRRLHLWLAERYRQETELLQRLQLLDARL